MTDPKPWFRVMRPEDANQPGSQWLRAGAASRGKVVAIPIAPQGWLALLAFVAVLMIAPIIIWLPLFLTGSISLVAATVLTVAIEATAIVAFIGLVRSRMTRLPPRDRGAT